MELYLCYRFGDFFLYWTKNKLLFKGTNYDDINMQIKDQTNNIPCISTMIKK